MERDHFGFVVEFVAGPEDDEDGENDVGGDEGIDLERDESVVTLEEGNNGGGGEGKIRTPRLERGLVGQVITGVTLNLESLHESTIGWTLANGYLVRESEGRLTCGSKRYTSK
jgi:hypothetical protein